ncbi:MAG TPA: hypothetical protein VIM71_11375 [Lacunisphaera sp.]
MIPLRVIRSGMLLAGLVLALGAPLRAATGGFMATLSQEEQAAAGLTTLTALELAALDELVAGDLARARQLKTSALPGTLGTRHPGEKIAEAGLDRLTPEQLAKLNALVDEAVYNRPQPKDRPRLRDSDVLSEQGRLQVHGGMSFTYGWAGGGRNFRETSAWVSYYDPVTGLGLGFGFSNFTGDALYGYYPGDYYYDRGYYPASRSYYSASPRMSFASAERTTGFGATQSRFKGDGASLRAPVAVGRGSRH